MWFKYFVYTLTTYIPLKWLTDIVLRVSGRKREIARKKRDNVGLLLKMQYNLISENRKR